MSISIINSQVKVFVYVPPKEKSERPTLFPFRVRTHQVLLRTHVCVRIHTWSVCQHKPHFQFLALLTCIFLTLSLISCHEDTPSLLPNTHLDRTVALLSFLFEIPFSMPFLDHSAIVVWWHLLALRQLFSSFSWAFFVRVLPQNHGKLQLLGKNRHRLTFLPCRRHRHRHLHQTHPSSLSVWFVVMCCGLKSTSRKSEDLNQQEFLLLHLNPGNFKIWGNYDTNT